MKLDRNLNPDGKDKYALILMRQFESMEEFRRICQTVAGSSEEGKKLVDAIDIGDGEGRDFFVLRMKDRYAQYALKEYYYCCVDQELSDDVSELYEKARKYGTEEPT